MRKLIRDRNLHDIAAAIRTKNGSNGTYKPREMADAIRALPSPSTLVPKAITENGSYSPQSENADGYSSVTVNVGRNLVHKSITRNGSFRAASDHVDGYSSVSVNVPNSYSALDEGKVVSGGALSPQTSLSVTQNGTFDTTRNNQVTVSVANSFSADDEGKVIQNGVLTAQTALNITENGSYNTTAKDFVAVNVSGGSGAEWQYIPPPVYNASFIDNSSSLSIDSTVWTSYRFIALDLEEFSGRLIQIDNRANDRNWWGLFSSVSRGQAIVWPSVRQSESSQTLTFFADDFLRHARYLVYDFTSSNQDAPVVRYLNPPM